MKVSRDHRLEENAGQVPVSPVCAAEPVVIEKTFSRDEIVQKYAKYLRIDVAADLQDCPVVMLCRGRESNLRFFWPLSAAGNGAFYEKLMALPHYYIADKWEHSVALEMLPPSQRVLEIGCGSGHFLSMLQAAGHIGTGLEINSAAILAATAAGLDVRAATVEQFARECDEPFDVICAFQVLEHLTNPLAFIAAGLRCLREDGLAIFAVPNGEGVFSSLDVALDMPPHHMLRWNGAALQFLTKRFPLVLTDFQCEPMSRLHLGLLANACFDNPSLRTSGLPAIRRYIVGSVVSKYWSWYLNDLSVAGHTLLCAFRKSSAQNEEVTPCPI